MLKGKVSKLVFDGYLIEKYVRFYDFSSQFGYILYNATLFTDFLCVPFFIFLRSPLPSRKVDHKIDNIEILANEL